jgi:catechol 2,3-dioxygenase-like lactoylglutathione lyase family enzyme
MNGIKDSLSATRLGTVIIFTRHMDALSHFYAEALGIGPYDHLPGHMGCEVGNIYFGFDQVDELEVDAGGRVTLWFIVDNIQSTFDQLVRLGAKVRYGPTRKPWGALLASVLDPDGNIIGISQR